ncbi:unnamed protein product [Owenia fusiformis]|uniref:Coiled-coil domain-containing protein 172 n=1 Tax=Owenia fusiformis TaxID=6347 RepID=A0A8S4NSX7_OWEFU|nr:unnamed protein product [Owenia fusiformis]
MSDNLDTLFEQILHSEQRAQAKKTFLNEIKQKILKYQDQIEGTIDEKTSLKGHISVKLQQLKQSEVQLHCVETRQKILHQQLQKLKDQLHHAQTELQNKVSDVDAELDAFCTSADIFTQDFDLMGEGRKSREKEGKQLLEQLQGEQTALETELSSFLSHQAAIEELEKNRSEAKLRCKNTLAVVKNCDEQIQKELQKFATLEEEKERVSQIPKTDPEFLKLSVELEMLKDDSLEGLCQALKQQLQQLKQQQWQQQLHQQHKQRVLTQGNKVPKLVSSSQAPHSNTKSVRNFQFKARGLHNVKVPQCQTPIEDEGQPGFVPASAVFTEYHSRTQGGKSLIVSSTQEDLKGEAVKRNNEYSSQNGYGSMEKKRKQDGNHVVSTNAKPNNPKQPNIHKLSERMKQKGLNVFSDFDEVNDAEVLYLIMKELKHDLGKSLPMMTLGMDRTRKKVRFR